MFVLLLSDTSRGELPEQFSTYKGWKISSFNIEGLAKETAGQLKNGLAIPRSFSKFRRRKPVFYPNVLSDDIGRARLFLARNGYPYASVNPVIVPRPDRNTIEVRLAVTTGPAVRVEAVEFEQLPDSLFHQVNAGLELRPGSIFTDQGVIQEAAGILRGLRRLGFANAQVEHRTERIDSLRVNVIFKAEPNGIFYFGGTLVKGAAPDLVPLVRKSASIPRGERYSPERINRAYNNIRLLDLFRKIRLNPTEALPDTLTLEADLLPRKPRTIEFGIGYWTDGQLRVRSQWLHRNLFGAGRGLSIGGTASRHLQMARLSFWWPALLAVRTRESVSATLESQMEDSYDLFSTGGEIANTYRHSIFTSTRLGIEISNVDVTVKTDQRDAFTELGGLLSVASFRWTRNAANDRLYPTAGTVTWLRLEWAPNGSLSDSHYAFLETSGTAYLPLSESSTVALRLNIGLAEPTGNSRDLLPNKRFFTGGATSVRGFERRRLGPMDDEGSPLGGEAKMVTSLEIRTPLWWRFHGALFIDTGQVWSTIEDVRPDQIEAAAGPGLMLRTPVGPVRADVGWRLTDYVRNQPTWVFHLSIGHPF